VYCVVTEVVLFSVVALLIEQQIAVSTISHWQLHCLLIHTVLKNYTNKARLNVLICEQVLSDNDFLSNSTQNHKLVVTEDKSEPTQVSEGQKHPVWIFRQCMKRPTSSLQQAIHPYCQRRSRINSLSGFWWHCRICFATVLLLEWEASINTDYAVTS